MDELIKRRTIDLLKSKDINVSGDFTQTNILKILREQYHIHVGIYFKPNNKTWDMMPYDMRMNGREYLHYVKKYQRVNGHRNYNTMEEAIEEGIYEALSMVNDSTSNGIDLIKLNGRIYNRANLINDLKNHIVNEENTDIEHPN